MSEAEDFQKPGVTRPPRPPEGPPPGFDNDMLEAEKALGRGELPDVEHPDEHPDEQPEVGVDLAEEDASSQKIRTFPEFDRSKSANPVARQWGEIVASPKFREMSLSEKEATREEFIKSVVIPSARRNGENTRQVVEGFRTLTSPEVDFDQLTKHHLKELPGALAAAEITGKRSTPQTVRPTVVGINDEEWIIPTVWDGKVLPINEAIKRAIEEGPVWPRFKGKNALDKAILASRKWHQGMGFVDKPDDSPYQAPPENMNFIEWLGHVAKSATGSAIEGAGDVPESMAKEIAILRNAGDPAYLEVFDIIDRGGALGQEGSPRARAVGATALLPRGLVGMGPSTGIDPTYGSVAVDQAIVQAYMNADEQTRKRMRGELQNGVDRVKSDPFWVIGDAIDQASRSVITPAEDIAKSDHTATRLAFHETPKAVGQMAGFVVASMMARRFVGGGGRGMVRAFEKSAQKALDAAKKDGVTNGAELAKIYAEGGRKGLERWRKITNRAGVGLGAVPLGVAMEGSNAFEEALESNATFEQAVEAHFKTAPAGLLEGVPIGRMLDRIDEASGGRVRAAFINALKTGSENAIQEVAQTIWEQGVKIGVYDPEASLWHGTGEAGTVGFSSGALVAFLGSVLIPGRHHSQNLDVEDSEGGDSQGQPDEGEAVQDFSGDRNTVDTPDGSGKIVRTYTKMVDGVTPSIEITAADVEVDGVVRKYKWSDLNNQRPEGASAGEAVDPDAALNDNEMGFAPPQDRSAETPIGRGKIVKVIFEGSDVLSPDMSTNSRSPIGAIVEVNGETRRFPWDEISGIQDEPKREQPKVRDKRAVDEERAAAEREEAERASAEREREERERAEKQAAYEQKDVWTLDGRKGRLVFEEDGTGTVEFEDGEAEEIPRSQLRLEPPDVETRPNAWRKSDGRVGVIVKTANGGKAAVIEYEDGETEELPWSELSPTPVSPEGTVALPEGRDYDTFLHTPFGSGKAVKIYYRPTEGDGITPSMEPYGADIQFPDGSVTRVKWDEVEDVEHRKKEKPAESEPAQFTSPPPKDEGAEVATIVSDKEGRLGRLSSVYLDDVGNGYVVIEYADGTEAHLPESQVDSLFNVLPEKADAYLQGIEKIRDQGSSFADMMRSVRSISASADEDVRDAANPEPRAEGEAKAEPESAPIGATEAGASGEEQSNVEVERDAAFQKLADEQRGAPEAAMLRHARSVGSGVMSYAMEHVGDLTHRMASRFNDFKGYGDEVYNKASRALDTLKSGYGFLREHQENMRANAAVRRESDPDVSGESLDALSQKLGQEYADAHSKLKVYNRPQWLAREAAVALGERRIDDAVKYLEELKEMAGKDNFSDLAGEFNPEGYNPDQTEGQAEDQTEDQAEDQAEEQEEDQAEDQAEDQTEDQAEDQEEEPGPIQTLEEFSRTEEAAAPPRPIFADKAPTAKYSKDDLRMMAGVLGVPDSGTKEDIASRIRGFMESMRVVSGLDEQQISDRFTTRQMRLIANAIGAKIPKNAKGPGIAKAIRGRAEELNNRMRDQIARLNYANYVKKKLLAGATVESEEQLEKDLEGVADLDDLMDEVVEASLDDIVGEAIEEIVGDSDGGALPEDDYEAAFTAAFNGEPLDENDPNHPNTASVIAGTQRGLEERARHEEALQEAEEAEPETKQSEGSTVKRKKYQPKWAYKEDLRKAHPWINDFLLLGRNTVITPIYADAQIMIGYMSEAIGRTATDESRLSNEAVGRYVLIERTREGVHEKWPRPLLRPLVAVFPEDTVLPKEQVERNVEMLGSLQTDISRRVKRVATRIKHKPDEVAPNEMIRKDNYAVSDRLASLENEEEDNQEPLENGLLPGTADEGITPEVSEEEAQKALDDIFKTLESRTNDGLNPETVKAISKLGHYYLERGRHSFSEWARAMFTTLSQRGAELAQRVAPYLKGVYNALRKRVSETVRKAMDSRDVVKAEFQKFIQEISNAYADGGAEKGGLKTRPPPINKGSVRPQRSPAGKVSGASGGRSSNGNKGSKGNSGVSATGASDGGKQGAPGIGPNGTLTDDSLDGDVHGPQESGGDGVVDEQGVDGRTGEATQPPIPAGDTKWGDAEQAKQHLTGLFDSQIEDVLFAENRFFDTSEDGTPGRGVMFTNGTGTGKTRLGLGIIKRFVLAGRPNVLVVTPSQDINQGWLAEAGEVGVDLTLINNTKDNGGSGPVITTYANFTHNKVLFDREWDMIIYDESHNIMKGIGGDATGRYVKHRALTRHPSQLLDTAKGILHDKYDALEEKIKQALLERMLERNENYGGRAYGRNMSRAEVKRLTLALYRRGYKSVKRADRGDAFKELFVKTLSDVRHAHAPQEVALDAEAKRLAEKLAEQKDEAKIPKVVFLSASPFSYRTSIQYAEGYLFRYDGKSTYSLESYKNEAEEGEYHGFMMGAFGYRLVNGQLVEPEPGALTSTRERKFHEWLRGLGALSRRMLDNGFDYSRDFVEHHDEIGDVIDAGMMAIRGLNPDGSASEHVFPLLEAVANMAWDYTTIASMREALNARYAIERAKQHRSLGRKVLIFHNYTKRFGRNPFKMLTESDVYQKAFERIYGREYDWTSSIEKLHEEFDRFAELHPDAANLDLSDSKTVPEAFSDEFGDDAVILNGTVNKRLRKAGIKAFNSDEKTPWVIVIQVDAGKEGVSLHDTTGKWPRASIVVGIPEKATDVIQLEGRTYRVGNQSNAIYEYLKIGTNFEAVMFANKVAVRAGTAENLGMGDDARRLTQRLADGYMIDARPFDPSPDQGVGAKDLDRDTSDSQTYEEAKRIYESQKEARKTLKEADGSDLRYVPEPLGMKMVEWARLGNNESVLEPSAGDGSIARWFGEETRNTVVEPSRVLRGRLGMANSSIDRVVEDTFEMLSINNKYDAIVMFPPTREDLPKRHLLKAMKHVRDGGRIVAVVPSDAVYDDEVKEHIADTKNRLHLVYNGSIQTDEGLFGGPTVGMRLLIIDKISEDALDKPVPRWRGPKDLIATTNNDLFDAIERLQAPDRSPKPKPKDRPLEMREDRRFEPGSYDTPGGKTVHTATLPRFLSGMSESIAREAARFSGVWSKTRGVFTFPSKRLRDAFIRTMSDPNNLPIMTPKSLLESRDNGPTRPRVTKERAVEIVERVTKGWSFDHPPIVVVGSAEELAEEELRKVVRGGALGFAHKGVAYIVAPRHRSDQSVIVTLMHEVIGHIAMRDMLGPRLWRIVSQDIVYGAGIGDPILSEAMDAVRPVYGNLPLHIQAIEAIAWIIQNRTSKDHWLVSRVIGAVRAFLRDKMGLNIRFTGHEIRYLLHRAGALVVHGNKEGVYPGRAPGDTETHWRGQDPYGRFDEEDIIQPEGPEVLESRRYETNEQAAATAKINPPRPFFGRVAAYLDEVKEHTRLRVRQKLIDRFASLRKILGNERAWKMAQLIPSAHQAAIAALHGGHLHVVDNTIQVKDGTVGAYEALEPLGSKEEIDRFFDWVIGNRAAILEQQGREKLFTEQDIQALLSKADGTMDDGRDRRATYEAVHRELDALHRSIVDVAVQLGAVSKREADMWKRDSYYVPFYRILDDESAEHHARGPRNMGTGKIVNLVAQRRLKGSDLAIADPMGNLIGNWMHLLETALQNQAARSALASAVKMGLAKKRKNAPARYVKRGTMAFYVLKNGKREWYEVDDTPEGRLVFDALSGISKVWVDSPAIQIAAYFRRIYTYGVTLSPEFRIRNLIRDTVTTLAISDANLSQRMKAASWTRHTAPEYYNLLASGAIFETSGFNLGTHAEHAAKIIQRGKGKLYASPYDPLGSIRSWFEKYQELGAQAENINRAAVFMRTYDRTGDLLEAAFEARDLLDFTRHGSSGFVRALTAVSPFLNARMQGLDKLIRAGSEKETRARVWTWTLAIAIAGIAHYLSYKDEDWYQELEDWERDTYWFFKIPGTDLLLALPRPFEIGSVAAIAERATEALISDKQMPGQLGQTIAHVLTQTFTIDWMSPLQTVKPFIEVGADRSRFSSRPIEGYLKERALVQDRYQPWTSDTAVVLSRAMTKVAGQQGSLSPVQIEHIVKGYLGFLGSLSLLVSDKLLFEYIADRPESPETRIDDIIGVRALLRQLPKRNSRYLTDFYDVARMATRAQGSFKARVNEGQIDAAKQVIEDYGGYLYSAKFLRKREGQMSKINKAIRTVWYAKNLTPEEKRERLDKLYQTRNIYARNAIEGYKAISGYVEKKVAAQ